MALIECTECKKGFSDKAEKCPNCGAPIQVANAELAAKIDKDAKRATWWGRIIFLIVIVGCIRACQVNAERGWLFIPPHQEAATPQLTPQEQAAQDKEALDANIAVQAAKQLRDSMRNPGSFVLEWAQTMDSGAVCMTYRAQNGFGGYSRENAVLPHTRDSIVPHASQSLWKKECEKGASRNVTTFVKSQL